MEEMTLETDKTGKTGTRDKTRGRVKQTRAARQQTRQTEGDGQTVTDEHADILYNTQRGRGRVVGERGKEEEDISGG